MRFRVGFPSQVGFLARRGRPMLGDESMESGHGVRDGLSSWRRGRL